MCRNITERRSLEPPATREEIKAASRQQPPKTVPPLRRHEVRQRIGLASLT